MGRSSSSRSLTWPVIVACSPKVLSRRLTGWLARRGFSRCAMCWNFPPVASSLSLKPAPRRLVGIDMWRFRLSLITPAVALVLASCRTSRSDPVPAGLPGSYVYAGQGSTFKHPWQFSARLDLTPDRRYKLTLDKTIEGNRDPTETNVGSFTVSGDHIQLREDAGLPDK